MYAHALRCQRLGDDCVVALCHPSCADLVVGRRSTPWPVGILNTGLGFRPPKFIGIMEKKMETTIIGFRVILGFT